MLKVDNVTLPEPKAMIYDHNKIWSANTGRLDNGYFVGDLIATKRKLNITWGACTASDAQKIINAVNKKFVEIQYTAEDGSVKSGNFYWGDASGEAYNFTVAHIMSGFSCNAIER